MPITTSLLSAIHSVVEERRRSTGESSDRQGKRRGTLPGHDLSLSPSSSSFVDVASEVCAALSGGKAVEVQSKVGKESGQARGSAERSGATPTQLLLRPQLVGRLDAAVLLKDKGEAMSV